MTNPGSQGGPPLTPDNDPAVAEAERLLADFARLLLSVPLSDDIAPATRFVPWTR